MLQPIRPAAPIQAKYEARVLAMLLAMHRDILAEVRKTWRQREPETIITAMDDIPARALQLALSRVGKVWLKRFDTLADELAEYFATAVRGRCDRTLADMLRRGGFSVKFTMTPAMRDAYTAVRAENVGLIRSIAEQHLSKVETLVMQSVSRGGDLGTLTDKLQKNFGISQRRAAFIARDQNSKATAVLRRVREAEIGVVEGIWRHSAGGKHPREKHVSFSGKRFKLADGHDFGDGMGPVLPGEAPNCRCSWRAVLPGFE
jgi:uncharacterized protein with gpF-like domain